VYNFALWRLLLGQSKSSALAELFDDSKKGLYRIIFFMYKISTPRIPERVNMEVEMPIGYCQSAPQYAQSIIENKGFLWAV
jgi:hypothetical protein